MKLLQPRLIGLAASLLVAGAAPALAQRQAEFDELRNALRKLRDEVAAHAPRARRPSRLRPAAGVIASSSWRSGPRIRWCWATSAAAFACRVRDFDPRLRRCRGASDPRRRPFGPQRQLHRPDVPAAGQRSGQQPAPGLEGQNQADGAGLALWLRDGHAHQRRHLQHQSRGRFLRL